MWLYMRLFGFMFKLYCASVSLFFSQTQGILQASPLLLNFLISLFFCLVLHQTCFFIACGYISGQHWHACPVVLVSQTVFEKSYSAMKLCVFFMIFSLIFYLENLLTNLGFLLLIFHKDWALLMLEMSTVQWLFS